MRTSAVWLLLGSGVVCVFRVEARDCNRNRKDDAVDIAALEPGFGEPELIAAVGDPSALIALDAEGDGDTDLVAASAETRTITVVINAGGGRFAVGATLPAGGKPDRIVAGDLDVDGLSDLVIVSAGAESVALLRNQGGAFEAPWTLRIPGVSIADVAVKDIDRDGDLDLAIAGEDSAQVGSISLFLNDGKGGLAPGPVVPTQRYSPIALVADDLDGDGDADLATVNSPRGMGVPGDLSILLQSGDRTFRAAPEFPRIGAGRFGLLTGRINDDDRVDMVVTPSAAVLLSNGDGTFNYPPGIGVSRTGNPSVPALLDLNGDGMSDLALAQFSSQDCARTTGWANLFLASEGALRPSESTKLKTDPRGLVAADFDGDGKVDLAVAGVSPAGVFLVARKLKPRSNDCNSNGIPDECEVEEHDCNSNGTPDDCDLTSHASQDCNRNLLPDECERDCDGNGVTDDCDIASGASGDCNSNGIPDSCELGVNDHDQSATPDDCDIANGSRPDCNSNGVPDAADLLLTTRFSALERLPGSGRIRASLPVDLDGDSDLDIAVAREGIDCPRSPGSISVLINLGHGGFVEGTWLPSGLIPVALAAGDFDGDGDVDIAVGHASSDTSNAFTGIALFLGRGNGLLEVGPWFGDGTPSLSLLAADLDQDGDTDLVAVSRGPLLFLNNGHGAFKEQGSLLASDEGSVRGVALRDIDRDGDLDLAAAAAYFDSGRGALRIRLYDGRWPLIERRMYLDTGTMAYNVLPADFNGDSDLDLVAGRDNAEPAIFRSRGGGVFSERADLVTNLNGHPEVVQDLDGDGREDLVVWAFSEPGGVVLIYSQHGQEGFKDPIPFIIPRGTGVNAAGDFDDDGNQDLLLRSNESTSIAWSVGAGHFLVPRMVSTGDRPKALDAADLDGDGSTDLITASSFAIGLLWNGNDGTFTSEDRVPIGSNPALVLARDLNGDGRIDLVAANSLFNVQATDNVSVVVNEGGREFSRALNFAIPRNPIGLAAADMDGDADLDLVVLTRDSFAVLENQGDGAFGSAARFDTGIPAGGMTLGDLDADGDVDVAILDPAQIGATPELSSPGSVVLFRNAGRGELATGVTLQKISWAGGIIAADIDGDGRTDLVFTNRRDHAVAVTLQRSPGDLTDSAQYSLGRDAEFVVAADLDVDGRLDLIVSSDFPDPGTTVLLNRGDQRFSEPIRLSIETARIPWTVADFTGDGLPDLAAVPVFGSEIVIIDNLSSPASLDVDHNGIPDECEAGGARFLRGDSNGDGKLDISDAATILRFLFTGGAAPGCDDASDANDDGRVNVTDPVAILLHLFAGAGPLAPPFGHCGPDPRPDALDCKAFPPCP